MAGKVVHLPGTRLSAEVVLTRTMQNLPRIKAVAVVIMWDDDSFDMDWSNMKRSELAMAASVMRLISDRELLEEPSGA